MTLSLRSTGSYTLWKNQDCIIKTSGKNRTINQLYTSIIDSLDKIGNKEIKINEQTQKLNRKYDLKEIKDHLDKAKNSLCKNRLRLFNGKNYGDFDLSKLTPKAEKFYKSIKELEQALANLARKIEICDQNKAGNLSYFEAEKEFKVLDKTVRKLLNEASSYIPKNKSRLKTYAAITVGLTAVSIAIGITIFTLGIAGTLTGVAIGSTGPIVSCLVRIATQFILRRDPAWKHLEAVLEKINSIYDDLEEQEMNRLQLNFNQLQLNFNQLTQNFDSLTEKFDSLKQEVTSLSQQIRTVGNKSDVTPILAAIEQLALQRKQSQQENQMRIDRLEQENQIKINSLEQTLESVLNLLQPPVSNLVAAQTSAKN